MPLFGILELCVKAAAIFRLKRSAFHHSVWRILEKPHIASLPLGDMVNRNVMPFCVVLQIAPFPSVTDHESKLRSIL